MATMLLSEKFAKGLIKEETYIPNFQPDFKECILTSRETGWKENQVLHTEEGMKWQIVFLDGKMALVANERTKQNIHLQGEAGAEKGIEALKKYSKTCWSSREFRATGIFMTQKQFVQLPLKIRKYKLKGYWLGSYYFIAGAYYAGFGVQFVNHGNVNGDSLYSSSGNAYSYGYGVRPAVLLPSDIMIDDNNNLVPFDKETEPVTEIGTFPSSLMSNGKKAKLEKKAKAMIAEQEKKLTEQKELFNSYFAQQKELLEIMKDLLSKL